MKGNGAAVASSRSPTPDGTRVENPGKYRGFTLLEARVYLDQLPDRRLR